MKRTLSCILAVLLLFLLSGCKPIEDFLSAIDWNGKTDNIEVQSINPHTMDEEELKKSNCYSELDSEQQRIYNMMYTAVSDMQIGWIDLGKCRSEYIADISVAYQALSSDNPQLFWMPYNYIVSKTGSGEKSKVNIAFSHTSGKVSCDYLIDKSERDKMVKALDEKVAEITNAVKTNTAYDKELYFHDFICNTVKYSKDKSNSLIYTAYGALINGSAVCEGYSRAMQLLCQKAGIPCVVVSGSSKNEGHMWNIINPCDGWYHLDVTWDDQEEIDTPIYSYFNLTDEGILKTHKISPHYTDIKIDGNKPNFNILNKECNKTTYNYFLYSNLLFSKNDISSVAQSILNAAEKGKTNLQFQFESNEFSADFAADYQTYITRIQRRLNSSKGVKAPQIDNISLIDGYVIFYWN